MTLNRIAKSRPLGYVKLVADSAEIFSVPTIESNYNKSNKIITALLSEFENFLQKLNDK